ncbi:ABC transporter permease [Pedobacter panaciterrae]|jgi:ABC-type transport system, involved in lipoprotein release, permease component|uniref:FtsX-like permease family protein n=1 Tax=Pedobacter panaciterrae TaxID=363849 RepID=A0ABU8NIA6_9SPHI|nr:ABC transporter permease [Pedobacter panaciterrae]NQX53699.1 ABC transporter permease [Pedobacter panaciterrae]
MFKLNLKIALRNLWKNKAYTAINIGGLAIALAAFILVILYVTYETSYDKDVPNYDRIYQVGRSLPDFKTEYTPAPLAKLIKDNFPEVEVAGKMTPTWFEFPINTEKGRVYSNKALLMDFKVARMLNIWPDAKSVDEKDPGFQMYVPKLFIKELFSDKKVVFPTMVGLGPKKDAQPVKLFGTIERTDEHSNIKFDIVSLSKDIGLDNKDYGTNNFRTFIQVKDGANIEALQQKIDQLYKTELIKGGMTANDRRIAGRSVIFLDPLKNLHLRPMAGNDTNYKIVVALFGLGTLIIIIACINFTNLTIAQATKRAKEVGVKKVLGAYRFNLTFQFLAEIFMQCLLALILGLILAEMMLPLFNNLFGIPLSIWHGNTALFGQLILILLGVTVISGIYPALVLSGYKPASVLKGNMQTSYKTLWLRNSLLAGQFVIAIIFIAGLLIVNNQLKYMQAEDKGFKPSQVVFIKNIQFYNKPKDFESARNKIMKIPGVNNVTVASDIPDGSKPGTNNYKLESKELSMDFLDVNFDYFETLGIKLKSGRFFSRDFIADTAVSAILNETAVARYGVTNPVGKVIRGCNMDYKIVGVVKDFKAQGFEATVAPTIYAIKNPCNEKKIKIMVNIDQSSMTSALAALKSQWSDINTLDGEDFRYEFLDELYGKLFKKQEQLQSVFFFAAMLTIFIAVLGLFAFSAFTTNNRIKEISIRKILGATDFQMFKMLNTFFIGIVLIANLIAWPLAYVLAKKWLETFAYRIDIPLFPFVIAALFSTVLTVLTVSIQARKAVKTNPADALKYE